MSPCIGNLNLENEIRTKITGFFSLYGICQKNKIESLNIALPLVLCLSDLIEP